MSIIGDACNDSVFITSEISSI